MTSFPVAETVGAEFEHREAALAVPSGEGSVWAAASCCQPGLPADVRAAAPRSAPAGPPTVRAWIAVERLAVAAGGDGLSTQAAGSARRSPDTGESWGFVFVSYVN